MTKKAHVKKKAPAQKASSKKTTAQKPKAASAEKKPPKSPALFREIRSWSDCKDQKLLIWSPALGVGPEANGYHKAKVLGLDLNAGSILVFVATESAKGRYLIPMDTAAAKVK